MRLIFMTGPPPEWLQDIGPDRIVAELPSLPLAFRLYISPDDRGQKIRNLSTIH